MQTKDSYFIYYKGKWHIIWLVRGDGGESDSIPEAPPGVPGSMGHGGGSTGAAGALDNPANPEGKEEGWKYGSFSFVIVQYVHSIICNSIFSWTKWTN